MSILKKSSSRPNLVFIISAVFVFLLIAGCSALNVKSDSSANNSKLLRVVSNDSGDRAIIFIHGIFGNYKDTWKNSNGLYFWTLTQAGSVNSTQDSTFSNASIFAYGYPSFVYDSGSFTIDDAAKVLDERLSGANIYHVNIYKKYKQIILVTHSMGGLVADRLLIRMSHDKSKYLKKIPLLVTYSVPQNGSEIARIATNVASNPALETLVPSNGKGSNEYLRSTAEALKSLKKSGQIQTEFWCEYEKEPYYGIVIVPYESATKVCDNEPHGVLANHLTMVKPSSRDTDSYETLVSAINSIKQPAIDAEYIVQQSTFTLNFSGWKMGGNALSCDDSDSSIVEIDRHDEILKNSDITDPYTYDYWSSGCGIHLKKLAGNPQKPNFKFSGTKCDDFGEECRKHYTLTVPIGLLKRGESANMTNSFNFVNSFGGINHDFWAARIKYPTENIHVVFHFPVDKEITQIRVYQADSHGNPIDKSKPLSDVYPILGLDNPVIRNEQQYAEWNYDKQLAGGQTIRFDWEWKARDAAPN